jgi:hypothetical protein
MKKSPRKLLKEILNRNGASSFDFPKMITKKFDAKKFCGAINYTEDAIIIQTKLRNEW